MATNAYETYLESRVLTAEPVELVHILCYSALEAIRQARLDLREGRIRERSRAITRASDMLNELALSLDHQAGGELSRNLVELYAYVQKLLVDGNLSPHWLRPGGRAARLPPSPLPPAPNRRPNTRR